VQVILKIDCAPSLPPYSQGLKESIGSLSRKADPFLGSNEEEKIDVRAKEDEDTTRKLKQRAGHFIIQASLFLLVWGLTNRLAFERCTISPVIRPDSRW